MKYGFTLVELLLVMGIMAVLFSLGSITFFSSFKSVNISSVYDTLVADLNSQQSRAMAGEGRGGAEVTGWGVKIDGDKYTLFSAPYVQGSSNNTIVPLPQGVTLSSNFPNSGEVIFTRGTGEILNFNSSAGTITVTFNNTNKAITFNKYGKITSN